MKHHTTLPLESVKQTRGACIRALFSAAAILLLPVVAHSQTLLLNFGNETITNWNKLGTLNADLAAGSVIDDGGVVMTGVAITTNNFASALTNTNTPIAYASGGTAASWVVQPSAVTTVWLRSGGGAAGTVVISGLNNALTYSLEVVSGRSTVSTNKGVFTANGLASNNENGISASFLGHAEGWVKGTILSWSSLTPTGGSITLNVNGFDSGNTSFINALKLTAAASSVPEPSTYALLVGGFSLAIVGARRRAHRG